jgi:hypothetical protein
VLFLLAFAKADALSTAILVDEFDAGHFQGSPNRRIVSSRHGCPAVG